MPRHRPRAHTLGFVTATDATPNSDFPSDASVVVLAVEGMHCGSCAALIEETLAEQTGVTSASVDLDAARAVIGFDPSQIDVDELTAAVVEAGYAATPVG
jgi:Cu+-exporting ATPase